MFASSNRCYWVLSLSLCLYFMLSAGKVAVAQNGHAAALQVAAEMTGAETGQLAVVKAGKASFTYSAKAVNTFKVEDKKTGRLFKLSIDDDGVVCDEEDLVAAEIAAYTSRFGRMDPELAQTVAGPIPEAQGIPVIVWLNQPAYQRPARPDPKKANAFASEADAEAFFAEVDAKHADAVKRATEPLARELRSMGHQVMTNDYAPMLASTLPVQTIRSLSNRGNVSMIYLDRINQPELEIARQTIKASNVHTRGITGTGVRLAQVEVGGRIATANPYLTGVTFSPTYTCPSVDSHSTAVAGIICSTHPTRLGIAYGSQLWAGGSCNGTDSELTNRSRAAADWGARVINLSWGSNTNLVPGAMDRFYDSMVINRLRTIVKSAGNRGAGCGLEGNITSPGLAYNVITVGAFDDQNSIAWSDDVMHSCSSWRDPISIHNDREKPEVAAPGANINSTTTAFPWTGGVGSGTSFSAPMVTGVAGLLMQRRPTLQAWPEAVKAIIMASAINNIEGAARLSEVDGRGGVVANRADDIARRYNGNFGGRSYTCSTPSPLNLTTMDLYAGMRTRVVICWDNDPNYTEYTQRPSADLDLRILNASGTTVRSSVSFDNNYEVVDFTPTVTGNYTIQVSRINCAYSPKYLGWAWRRGN